MFRLSEAKAVKVSDKDKLGVALVFIVDDEEVECIISSIRNVDGHGCFLIPSEDIDGYIVLPLIPWDVFDFNREFHP